ncbi:MAG TPA: O-antigen ligase family protein [Acidimicrobiales bacterium]|nr:O-antigen ligase family protein [Acidimicrobiales bacterium]
MQVNQKSALVTSRLEPSEQGWLTKRSHEIAMTALVPASSVFVGATFIFGPVAAAVALIGVGLGLAILYRPAIGGLLLAGAVPATAGLQRGVPIPGLRLSESLIVGVAALVLVPTSRLSAFRWCALDFLAVAYAGAGILLGSWSLARRGAPFDATNVGTMLGPVQFFLLYRTVMVSLSPAYRRRQALRLLLLASLPMSAVGILQQLNIGGTRQMVIQLTGGDVFYSWSYLHTPRATSLFPGWHPFAGYLFIILLLTVVLLLDRSSNVMGVKGLVVVLAAGSAALVLTTTLTTLAAFVAGTVVLALWYGHLERALAWSLVAVLAIAFLFGPVLTKRLEGQQLTAPGEERSELIPQTIGFRLEIWKEQYIPVISRHLVMGYGPDLPPEITWLYTESLYLTLLLRGGIPLLALYAALMWALCLRARRLADSQEAPCRAVARLLIVLVALLVPMHAVFPYFTSSGLPQPMWVLIGIMLAAAQHRVQRDPTDAAVARSS